MQSNATDMMAAIRGIYDCVLADAAAGSDLDGIRRLIGASHVVATTWGATSGSSRSCTNLDEEALLSINPAAIGTDYVQAALAIPDGCVLRMSSLLPMSDFIRSDAYQDVFRPLDGGNAAITQWRGKTGWNAVSVCRPIVPDQDFDDDAIAVLNVVLPHIRIADEMRGRRRAGHRPSAASLDRLEMLDVAAIVVDATGRPLHLNGKALRLAFGEPELVVARHEVRLRNEAANRLLQAAIRSALMLGTATSTSEDIVKAGLAARRQIRVTRTLLKPPLSLTVGPAHAIVPDGPGSRGVLILIDEGKVPLQEA